LPKKRGGAVFYALPPPLPFRVSRV